MEAEGEDHELKLLISEETGRFMGFRRREGVTGMASVASCRPSTIMEGTHLDPVDSTQPLAEPTNFDNGISGVEFFSFFFFLC